MCTGCKGCLTYRYTMGTLVETQAAPLHCLLVASCNLQHRTADGKWMDSMAEYAFQLKI